MKTPLTFILLIACAISLSAQKTIKLKPDTTDKYTLCFKKDRYTLFFGYEAFFSCKAMDWDIRDKKILRWCIDSGRVKNDTCILSYDFFDEMGDKLQKECRCDTLSPYEAEAVANSIATVLLAQGNVRIYSDSAKKYLAEIYSNKKRYKIFWQENKKETGIRTKFYDKVGIYEPVIWVVDRIDYSKSYDPTIEF